MKSERSGCLAPDAFQNMERNALEMQDAIEGFDRGLDALTTAADGTNSGTLQLPAALRRQNNDLRAMLDAIPEGVLTLDEEFNVLFANASVARLLGVTPLRRADRRFWDTVRTPRLMDAIRATFARAEPYATEFELQSPVRIV